MGGKKTNAEKIFQNLFQLFKAAERNRRIAMQRNIACPLKTFSKCYKKVEEKHGVGQKKQDTLNVNNFVVGGAIGLLIFVVH